MTERAPDEKLPPQVVEQDLVQALPVLGLAGPAHNVNGDFVDAFDFAGRAAQVPALMSLRSLRSLMSLSSAS